jgi:hypothetical protein
VLKPKTVMSKLSTTMLPENPKGYSRFESLMRLIQTWKTMIQLMLWRVFRSNLIT